MKQLLLVALLVFSTYFYFHNPAQPASIANSTAAQPAAATFSSRAIVVAAAPSSYNRWKTGPNAQTDLKTGPNAQTDFEPFAPNEQATWYETPGYTVIAGRTIRTH